jgi:N-acetyl-gamma-glutamyl-phosphate reductase
VVNSLTSYKFGGEHQHTPEIEEALSGIAKKETRISFTPILAPMPRGILATVSATTNLSAEEMRDQFVQFAQGKRFFNLLAPGHMPKTASLIGSNFISLQVAVDSHANRVVVSAAIDNLGKGAAGQAIQNANLMSGLSEEVGLTNLGIGQ